MSFIVNNIQDLQKYIENSNFIILNNQYDKNNTFYSYNTIFNSINNYYLNNILIKNQNNVNNKQIPYDKINDMNINFNNYIHNYDYISNDYNINNKYIINNNLINDLNNDFQNINNQNINNQNDIQNYNINLICNEYNEFPFNNYNNYPNFMNNIDYYNYYYIPSSDDENFSNYLKNIIHQASNKYEILKLAKTMKSEYLLYFMEGLNISDVELILEDNEVVQKISTIYKTFIFNNNRKYGNKFPRPLNSFMIYKKYFNFQLRREYSNMKFDNIKLNKFIALLWKNEKKEVQNAFIHRQNVHKLIHNKV